MNEWIKPGSRARVMGLDTYLFIIDGIRVTVQLASIRGYSISISISMCESPYIYTHRLLLFFK